MPVLLIVLCLPQKYPNTPCRKRTRTYSKMAHKLLGIGPFSYISGRLLDNWRFVAIGLAWAVLT